MQKAEHSRNDPGNGILDSTKKGCQAKHYRKARGIPCEATRLPMLHLPDSTKNMAAEPNIIEGLRVSLCISVHMNCTQSVRTLLICAPHRFLQSICTSLLRHERPPDIHRRHHWHATCAIRDPVLNQWPHHQPCLRKPDG